MGAPSYHICFGTGDHEVSARLQRAGLHYVKADEFQRDAESITWLANRGAITPHKRDALRYTLSRKIATMMQDVRPAPQPRTGPVDRPFMAEEKPR